jgi:NAD kinase
MYEKLVVVTLKTRLEELVERFNTREQARFYIEHMGLDFAEYEREHDTYQAALRLLRGQLDGLLSQTQFIERGFLPTFVFTPEDLVVTLGRDGLVVNTAKYLDGQPIVAVNPDPARIDGILLPFSPPDARGGVERVLERKARLHTITMAEVSLNDGQQLLAFNDFYLGQRTHLSSRYSLTWRRQTEEQSSSGVLVVTGAGSTGWFSSTQNMAAAVASLLLHERAPELPRLRLRWDDPRLAFVVREPFKSRASDVRLGAGLLEPGESLTFESHMPDGGVIFSDGVEADALAFNAGAVATVRAADRKTRLVAAGNPAGATRVRADAGRNRRQVPQWNEVTHASGTGGR